MSPSGRTALIEAAGNAAGRSANTIHRLTGWRRALVAMGAGAVSVLSLAPFFLWPILFVTMPILVWLIDEPDGTAGARTFSYRQDTRRSFSAGWLFGFGYFAAGLFWIGEAFLVQADVFAWLLPFAVTLLPAGLAVFWGAAAVVARSYWRPGLSRVVMLAAALGGTEWLRGHVLTGFPWNVVGYTLTSSDALMQSAALVGVYTLSLWAIVIFAGPLVVLASLPAADGGRARQRVISTALAVAAVPLICAAGFGYWRLSQEDVADVPGVKLRIVQPSIPQREKWMPEKQGEIFQLHLTLSRQNPAGETDDLRGITHVIWPEAAMPFRPLDHPEAISAIKELLGSSAYLFSGGLRVAAPQEPAIEPEGRPKAFNSLMVFGPGGGLSTVYDKIHLVPFGEYLPFQATLEAIGLRQLTHMRGGFSSGPIPRQPILVPGLPPAAVLVCYEAIFPGEVITHGERPQVIVNVTNDGWFGNTTGPRQHFHQSRVRAVEEGVPLLRAANNGISAVVDARGRTRQLLGMNVRGVIDAALPGAGPATPYSRWGDGVFVACLLVFFVAAIGLGRNYSTAN